MLALDMRSHYAVLKGFVITLEKLGSPLRLCPHPLDLLVCLDSPELRVSTDPGTNSWKHIQPDP